MKKNWTNPVLESLEIAETAGGTEHNTEADSEFYVNADGKWAKSFGFDKEENNS